MKTVGCFLASTLVLVCFTTTIALPAPVATWSPSAISVSLLRGTSTSAVASFSSTESLQNIDVVVVPELRRFVSNVPVHFDQVGPNGTNTIQIFFSIANSSSPGVYTGTLQLRSHAVPTRVLAASLPITIVVGQPSPNIIPPTIALPSLDRIIPASDGNPSYVANELDIFVFPGTTDAQLETLATIEGGTFIGHDAGLGLYQLNIPFGNLSVAADVSRRLQQSYNFIQFVAPSFPFQPHSTFPNDPSWISIVRADESWAQELIHLPETWGMPQTGSPTTQIALVDLGFLPHEDLAIVRLESKLIGIEPEHGIAVASLAAATGNNGLGLAGVDWSSHLTELEASGSDDLAISRMREAIDNAIKDGSHSVVINFSGGNELSPTCSPATTDAERSVQKLKWQKPIDYAAAHGIDALFVFSAGNNRVLFDDSLPAALSKANPKVISVGATDRLANEASYSNYGSVSIWAPGGDGHPLDSSGNVYNNLCGNRTSDPYVQDQASIWVAQPYNQYGFKIGTSSAVGTSLAAPFVSGVAGLMLSANPNITATQIKNIIMTTANDTGKVDPSGNPIKLLNAFNAIQEALAPPTQLSFSRTDFGTGNQPFSVAVGDFNNDGKLDVATANFGANTVSVLLGNGDGTFRTHVEYPIGVTPFYVVTGDFNADGKLDLAVATNSAVSVLLGNGDGTFQTHVDYPTALGEFSITLGDFNLDGKLDLAAAAFSDNVISVLLGNGNGTFQPHVDYPTGGGGPWSVTTGDVNSDGRLDLIVTNSISNSVSVLLGNGNGTFQAPVNYPTDSFPISVIAKDFNGDGRLDLAVVNTNSDSVSVLLGNGNGTFGPQTTYATGFRPASVASADLDGDGKLDLAVADFFGGAVSIGAVSILRGNGDGSFLASTEFDTGANPRSVIIADFNGDGKPDLAVAAQNANAVSILLNTSH